MELYLSRVMLDPASKAVMKDMSDPRDLHRTISRLFPSVDGQDGKPQHEKTTPRNAYNLLHRLDRKGESIVLYLQSSIPPDWSRMTPGYAARHDDKPVHHLYAQIKNGDRLMFRLTANPTKRAGKNDAGKERFRDENKRRRIDIRSEEGRIKWLERKGSECGFTLCHVSAADGIAAVNASMSQRLSFRHDSGRITLGAAIFDGLLEVTDAEAFRNALANGFGPGKAYGFGLMSVAPA